MPLGSEGALKSILWELFPVGRGDMWHLTKTFLFFLLLKELIWNCKDTLSYYPGYLCQVDASAVTPYLLTLYCLRLSCTQHIKRHCFWSGLRLCFLGIWAETVVIDFPILQMGRILVKPVEAESLWSHINKKWPKF